MKLSDYIVSFLEEKKITDVFGYPGGMVTHLMDSLDKSKKIAAHVTYNEQGAAFCACGYGQANNLPGVAYATSGPGATNLITGIANAFFDSIPCIFITGQVNTYESKGDLPVRQKGFQETDVIEMVKSVTKYSVQIIDANDIRYELEKSFAISMDGRRGPVLLDIPMNIMRADINPSKLRGYTAVEPEFNYEKIKKLLLSQINDAKRPLIIAGAGIKSSNMVSEFRAVSDNLGLPVVSSMISGDLIPNSNYYFGFIGAYGHRAANFATAKCDLIISIGSRLDSRQTGANKDLFAPNAKLIRIDIDSDETANSIKPDEIDIKCNLTDLLLKMSKDRDFVFNRIFSDWLEVCKKMRTALSNMDNEVVNKIVSRISEYVPDYSIITTDVGQNQVWVSQSFKVKPNQKLFFSGGHGAMGYSLPAAIGVSYSTDKTVVSFNGDGGFQMNIQELQCIARDNLNVKIVLLNNNSLGMIRHFQEMYFDSNFTQTTKNKGYTTPDFCKIGAAYGLKTCKINVEEDMTILSEVFSDNSPYLIEVTCPDNTYVFPKLAINTPINDQEPLINRDLFNSLMEL